MRLQHQRSWSSGYDRRLPSDGPGFNSRRTQNLFLCSTGALGGITNVDAEHNVVGFDHINRNAPVLIRTPKLTRFEPAQYWGGGPPGNSVVLNPLFFFFFFFSFALTKLLVCLNCAFLNHFL
jgi:hypothetical protein